MKLFKNTAYGLGLIFLLTLALLVISGRFGLGGVRALVVQSGSMEPAIGTKSIVLTVPATSYATGDVITFKQSGRNDVLVTHRIESIKTEGSLKVYTTKGDANEESDSEVVLSENIVGKVAFSVPFIGQIISFAQTTPGFILLIVVPAVAIVYSEILSIKKQVNLYLYRRKVKRVFGSTEKI